MKNILNFGKENNSNNYIYCKPEKCKPEIAGKYLPNIMSMFNVYNTHIASRIK